MLAQDPKNSDVLFPYINANLNSSLNQILPVGL